MEAPRWKPIAYAAGACCVAGYLYWSLVHMPAPRPGAITRAAPAVTAPKVAGPILKKPLQVVPKPAVRKAFPNLDLQEELEVLDTADIPAAENGVQTVTFINISTGIASTVYTPKPAPWFALEDRNRIGAGYEISTEGTRIPVYYRRDLLRVKDLHLVGEVGGKIPVGPGRIEGHAAGLVEWRF